MDNSKKKELINFLLSESQLIDSNEEVVKTLLQEEGFDYEKLKSQGSELITKALIKSHAASARQQLSNTLAQAKTALDKLRQSSETASNKIQELLQAKFGDKYAFNFRDLKNMNEKDALSILSDFEILDFLEKHKIESEKPE